MESVHRPLSAEELPDIAPVEKPVRRKIMRQFELVELVRAYDPEMSFPETVRLLLVSFDSTIKANLSVGAPLDLLLYDEGSLEAGQRTSFEADDPYFRTISEGWGDALKSALSRLPKYSMESETSD